MSKETVVNINCEVKLTPKQNDIYNGLKDIGEEIASFYLDGVVILNNTFKTKSYLLAHLAREIDGGLRDFLVVNSSLNELFCILCQKQTITKPSHKTSILLALDISNDSELSKKWFKIAKQYHKYAHRSGIWKDPRTSDEMINLWKGYEEILFELVGTFLNIHNLFDRIIKYDTPTKAIISTLNNLLKTDARYSYFFKNLQSLNWFEDLEKENYFNKINMHNFIYLEKVALENKDDEKKDTTKFLIKIIDNAILYRTNEDWREDWYILKLIFNMPSNAIKIEYMQFIWDALKTDVNSRILSSEIVHLVVPVLLENSMKEHLLKLIEILFDYKINSKSSHERELLVEKYWLYDLMNKYSKKIAKEVGIDGLKIVFEIINKVSNQDKRAFNNIWIVTIEKHSQNSFPDRHDNQIISFARDLLEAIRAIELKDIVDDLISKQEHPIFKRLAFHTINYHYDDLKDVFWQWFNSEKNISNPKHRHEYCKLLTDRARLFTDNELQKILDWIENLDYSKYYTDDELIFVSAYKKKEWLLCIKDYSNEAEKLYKKYNKIASDEIEHPCFDSWSSSFQLIDHSHIKDKKAFCGQSVDVIVKYIQDFDPDKEEKSPFDTNENLIEGLAEDIGNCIKSSPSKFSEELSLFDDLDYMHKYYIIYGFSRAWQEKQKFNWKNIFDFIDKTLNDDFLKSQDKYKFWLIGATANLIEYGTLKDDNSFDKNLLSKAKIILFKLLKNRENIVIDNDDWIHYILNSSDGKVLHALISYALRYGRLNSSQKVKWEKEVKDFFTHQLEQDDDYSLFVFTILGQYLDNLIFLDKEWVNTNFNKIFPIQNDKIWEVSIDGYFSYSTINKYIYTKFKDLGHLQKGIDFKFKQDRTSERIIQHISMAYMGDIDSETIFDIIKFKKSNNIIEIVISICSVYSNDYKKEDVEKINILWHEIFDIFKKQTNSEAQDIFSELCKWFVFIENIDETNIELLKLSAKYSEKQHNNYFITEELLRLVKDNAKYVGDIYLHMIENNVYPDYKKEDIEETISHLLKSENTNAIKICNKYAQRGIYFLNDLLKEANNEH